MSTEDEDRTPGHRSDEVDVVPLRQERSWWAWILLLLGPVTWATHFLVVYLLVEAMCSEAATGPGTWLGALAPISATIVATIAASLVVLGGLAFTARRYRQAIAEAARRENEGATDTDHQLLRDRQVLFMGLLLAPLSLIAILVVGLPALWVPVC